MYIKVIVTISLIDMDLINNLMTCSTFRVLLWAQYALVCLKY